jgi:hypothetical protein
VAVEYNFNMNAGEDWVRDVVLTASGSDLVITDATMQIRSGSGYLLQTLGTSDSTIVINEDGSLTLHLNNTQTLAFGAGLPGSSVVVGYAGDGLSYPYDLFTTYATGDTSTPWAKTLYGSIRVIPAITTAFPS